jgi:hypothetical protein
MVSIRKAKQGFQAQKLRKRTGGIYSQSDKEQMGLVAAGLCIGVLLVVLYQSLGPTAAVIPEHLRKSKPHPQLLEQSNSKPMGDRFDALALDILTTLDCASLFADMKSDTSYSNNNKDGDDDDIQRRRRRRRRLDEAQHGDDGGFANNGGLNKFNDGGGSGDDNTKKDDDTPDEEEKWGRDANDQNNNNIGGDEEEGANNFGDDGYQGGGGDGDYDGYFSSDITAKHLFCLAASANNNNDNNNDNNKIQQQIRCDASDSKRKTLLELWSAARAQMQIDAVLKVLELAREQKGQTLLGKSYDLWAPDNDDG